MTARLLLLLLLIGLAAPARALESNVVSSPRAQASLVTTLADLNQLIDRLDPAEPIKANALRAARGPACAGSVGSAKYRDTGKASGRHRAASRPVI